MATTYLHVTPTGSGTKDGITWAKAMDLAAWKTHMTNTVVADTIYYVAGGTYTFTSNFDTTRAGSPTPIVICGVKSGTTHEGATVVYSDWAMGNDRPVLVFAAYASSWGPSWEFKNLISTMTTISGFVFGDTGAAFNCTFINSSITAGRIALTSSKKCDIYGCECISYKGTGLIIDDNTNVYACYFHDSGTGVDATTGNNNKNIVMCVIDTMSVVGVNFGSGSSSFVTNNTIRNCLTGILATTGKAGILNNLILDCITPINWTSSIKSCWFAFNCEYNNTNADTNTQQIQLVTGDPVLGSAIAKGTDGTTNASSQFNAASAPFSEVTTADVLVVLVAGDPAATIGIYPITAVNSSSQLVLNQMYYTIGANKGTTTGITYGVIKGVDFTLGADGACSGAGLDAATYSEVTV